MSELKISLIMPAKNEEKFIGQAIDAIIKADYENWELIVIDDHSTDRTFDIVSGYAEDEPRIKVYKNEGNGKIVGLNYGFRLSKGEFIKCIDADDILDNLFFVHLKNGIDGEVMYHDSYITRSNLSIIGTSKINSNYLKLDFSYCLQNLKSLPRWAWSFNRDIGNKIFPMPEAIPFEDVWFSLIIRKYANIIKYIPEQLYYYRQNENQTYGGILNFSPGIVVFRAIRVLKLIHVLETDKTNQLTYDIDTK